MKILVVIGYGYLTPLVSSYSILFRCRLLVCEGCKGRKGKKGRRRREKMSFQFQLYFILVFTWLLCSEEMSSRTIWEPSFLLNHLLKYISRLRWSISSNSVWSCPVVFSYCLLRRVGLLTADVTGMRNPEDLAKQTCSPANSPVEESPFSPKGPAEVRANLSFFTGTVPFFASPHFLSGASGNFRIFKFIFILFTPTHIPFGCIVKFVPLAQFPVDNLSQLTLRSLFYL